MHVEVCVSPDNAIYMMLLLHPLSLNPWEKTVINLMARLSAFIKMPKASFFSYGGVNTECLLSHFQKAYFLGSTDFSTYSCCISKPQSENINCAVSHLLMQVSPLYVYIGGWTWLYAKRKPYQLSLMYVEIYRKISFFIAQSDPHIQCLFIFLFLITRRYFKVSDPL